MRSEALPWWRQAQADLVSAETLRVAGHHYAVSFFAQQAAEKALKAIYIERQAGRQPPRTHDLLFLGDQVRVPSALRAPLSALFPAFDLARYPVGTEAPVDLIDEELGRSHLIAAGQVLAWTARQISTQ